MTDLTAPPATSTREFTIPELVDAVAAAIPDREVVVFRDRRLTQAQLAERSRRFATFLKKNGFGVHTERNGLEGHEVGQDTLGIYAYNGNEYLESMLGAFRARTAPFNVNYRYVQTELRYLLADAEATAIVYHAAFAPQLAEVLPSLPHVRLLIQIADDSGNSLLPGAVDYETALAESDPEPVTEHPSPDDLYMLYTGGTTGMPKGVLWRQHDIFMAACGGRDVYSGTCIASPDEVATRAAGNPGLTLFVLPPLIHGAAQWAALTAILTGQTLVFSPVVDRLDPSVVAQTIATERPNVLMMVGDAIARPLAAEFADTDVDLSSVSILANGGAVLSPTAKQRLLDRFPAAVVIDGVGSSETGAQMTHVSNANAVSTGKFTPGNNTCVLTENLGAIAEPGHDGIGWLAQCGFVPLGYKGDPAKTAATFPTIDGERFTLPGDRARRLEDGSIALLGRDSVTINSGGEKIFVEEVEVAIGSHPAVADVLVAGRPSDKWGEAVVAIVELLPGHTATADDIAAHASESIARYKLPKSVLFTSEIRRSPVGKADYRWAKEQAATLGTA
ncbi:acyl-CoA synthetase [Rhodococcus artemisiae]|uniref:Acyl-CoA synthetase n=1 Tax=Rhodococcus artemisiae TaxID=714159 RepID=A0ABU7LAG5_9NOCA|nr:acyl-CoA synthetase [Rhodococcus artemisiae]MEE2058548.1 acyl-CoA synthetase [Rhodococcus artemisiae]